MRFYYKNAEMSYLGVCEISRELARKSSATDITIVNELVVKEQSENLSFRSHRVWAASSL